MLLVDIDMPHDCWQCKIEDLVHNCPCMQGVASASDYKECRHPNCPIQEVNEVQMVDIKDLLKRVEELETAVAVIKDWKENIESAEDTRLAEMGWCFTEEQNMFDKARANDKDYVLEAVRQNGHALQYASDELKNDKDVVQNNEDIIEAILAAANGNTEALQYVDPADIGD